MPTPTPQEIATQLEVYRITVAARDNTINILTSDLARTNVRAVEQDKTIADLQKEVESLKPKPAAIPA